ncbi:MAG: hypothetical protein NWE91_06055 [Candidatus Bathyarchaeota archaeon]|nr:hypothetical protein [Candidatus Bathyarchaeota archaeon]
MRGRNVLLALGVLVCLIGAFLMFDGSILGENTAGIATVIGITGIGIITQARKRIEK